MIELFLWKDSEISLQTGPEWNITTDSQVYQRGNGEFWNLGSEANDVSPFDRAAWGHLSWALCLWWPWGDVAFPRVRRGSRHRGSEEEGQQPVTDICPTAKGSVLYWRGKIVFSGMCGSVYESNICPKSLCSHLINHSHVLASTLCPKTSRVSS